MIQSTLMILKSNKMMMKMSIRKYLLYFASADSFLVAGGVLKGSNFLISSQLGFISSLLITLSSYYSYKKMVEHKVSIGDIPKDDRDELDKIDDRFELYDDSEDEKKDFKEIIKEERKKLKGFKRSAKNLKRSFFAFISPYRLFSYLFLILSFLYLNKHHLLDIFGFVLGISVVSIVALLVGFFKPTNT